MSVDALWEEVADWLERQAEQTIETSCARVFLHADVAWKVKRPVRFAFLDFSTPGKRKWALDRELEFNRRWTKDIYRSVRAVTRARDSFALDGEGEAVEWLLEMRRFDPRVVLAELRQPIDGELAERLGRLIARAHIEAPIAMDGGGPEALGYTIATIEVSLRGSGLGRDAVEHLIDRTRSALEVLTPVLESRRLAGFGRPCHGDLHLGNILIEDGVPVPFDCIEFNDRLSRIDVLYDAAFPIMDLTVRQGPEPANRLLGAYLDEAARGLPQTHWEGLAALPLFLSVRAAVRAHVSEATGETELAKRYLAAAEAFLQPTTPRLFALGGLSGTGKTTLARTMAPFVAGAPGAVILRSDEIRKRLWGAGHLDPLPPAAYEPEQDLAVYDEMFELAATIVCAGRSVVMDATFLAPETRIRADELATSLRVPFTPVWLSADPGALRARIAGRAADSSDAGVEVLERQLMRDLGPLTWPQVSVDAPAPSWS
ncbi:MAG TPA: AAA family ATPase [Caulobacteraceae bacterium]